MLDRLKLILYRFFPKKVMTELLGWGANKQGGWLTKAIIDAFIWFYKIDMREAKYPDTSIYLTFNDFFIRQLRDDLYFIDTDPRLLSFPVNGRISQLGSIQGDKVFQAKGHTYSLLALLAGNSSMTSLFENGEFITTYLAPGDYHRVHMPCSGSLRTMIYVPGELYSLNSLMVKKIPNLFARNERVICFFDTNFGEMAQILVGSSIVGSIQTSWLGTVTPPRAGIIKYWNWPNTNQASDQIALMKGEEMGCFKFGSTVINLFPPRKVKIVANLIPGSQVRFGQPMAQVITEDNQEEDCYKPIMR
ncbi:Phosphatidylserine decarboxylase proenzyme [Candidatus Erwinia haradaeae]|uniref:Phosphatidylserine decarboxylase proenzyme n=1 Tax=Candidatus Erwinia haradaeae TaxID=1922217 RepID=A0A451CZL5_9GAMM|nr:archaetidylserine decarboxylase [Candidatus Erwinia haradaeae]VFP78798.1 Phosphatidylserine decarboxylase proenzyme [Candidatus Erwinia haradaeae]